MLIKALYDYYDILEKNGETVPDGYSKVDIDYKIILTPNGKIEDIISVKNEVEYHDKKGKVKTKYISKQFIMPKRIETSTIKSNFIEHRALYIFGLNYNKNEKTFTVSGNKDKAIKSHSDFVKSNLEFIDGIDSPIVNAYRNFIINWKPEDETKNKFLMNLGNEYENAKFIFSLSGFPQVLLHEDEKIKEKNEKLLKVENKSEVKTQCAITGEKRTISRLHGKIKGIVGANSTWDIISVL